MKESFFPANWFKLIFRGFKKIQLVFDNLLVTIFKIAFEAILLLLLLFLSATILKRISAALFAVFVVGFVVVPVVPARVRDGVELLFAAVCAAFAAAIVVATAVSAVVACVEEGVVEFVFDFRAVKRPVQNIQLIYDSRVDYEKEVICKLKSSLLEHLKINQHRGSRPSLILPNHNTIE